jgi:hypothetical protein
VGSISLGLFSWPAPVSPFTFSIPEYLTTADREARPSCQAPGALDPGGGGTGGASPLPGRITLGQRQPGPRLGTAEERRQKSARAAGRTAAIWCPPSGSPAVMSRAAPPDTIESRRCWTSLGATRKPLSAAQTPRRSHGQRHRDAPGGGPSTRPCLVLTLKDLADQIGARPTAQQPKEFSRFGSSACRQVNVGSIPESKIIWTSPRSGQKRVEGLAHRAKGAGGWMGLGPRARRAAM